MSSGGGRRDQCFSLLWTVSAETKPVSQDKEILFIQSITFRWIELQMWNITFTSSASMWQVLLLT